MRAPGVLFWGIAVMAVCAFGALHDAGAESCFDHDLFSWNSDVDYRRALASETLAPTRATIGPRVASTGQSQAALEKCLGPAYRVAEDWAKRDAEQQCAYLKSIGNANSNSMHYYILEEQNRRKLSGSFRVCEWTLAGVGTLRAFLHRPSDSVAAHAYLLQLVMIPVPMAKVSYSKGSSLLLVRAGPPRVEWDISRNSVTIEKLHRHEER